MDDRGEIIIYQTEDGLTKIDVSMQDETVWLTQVQMAELFQRYIKIQCVFANQLNICTRVKYLLTR